MTRFNRSLLCDFFPNYVWLLFLLIAGILTVALSGCLDIFPFLNSEKVAEAQFDECFYGIGDVRNHFNPKDLSEDELQQCRDSGGLFKKNQGYLWGLTPAGDHVWFGTGANIGSFSLGSMLETAQELVDRDISNLDLSVQTYFIVAELAKSHYMNGELGNLGDYRPPRIFTYDIQNGAVEDKTPDDPLIGKTFGLRSAGSLNGVIFIAGPCMDPDLKGINFFAFDAQTRTYLGSRNMSDLYDPNGVKVAEDMNNIRKWLAVNGVLYTTVGTKTGGKVLRWTGSVSDPFQFQVVGSIDDQGTDLVYHENRLFIFTWPPAKDYTGVSTDFNSTNVCDIMMSKNEIPEDGLRPGTEFVKVWSVTDYEPDQITAGTYGMGGAASFDGYLYWGTMNIPGLAGIAHVLNRGDERWGLRDLVNAFVRTNRMTTVFRAKNFASGHPEFELLYGEEYLHKYENRRWKRVENNMHMAPLYGESGFDNNTNMYVWSMRVFDNQLYAGTFDISLPEQTDGLFSSVNKLVNTLAGRDPYATDFDIQEILRSESNIPGADLFRFPDTNSPAVPETVDCFGNHAGYGIRNMIVAQDALYVGTASSYNLHPHGGWELYKLTPAPSSGEE